MMSEIINYASGTCLFTSKQIFTQLDFFDSFLFAYHDDLDLCWRASMQGIQSYYTFHPQLYSILQKDLVLNGVILNFFY